MIFLQNHQRVSSGSRESYPLLVIGYKGRRVPKEFLFILKSLSSPQATIQEASVFPVVQKSNEQPTKNPVNPV